MPVADQMALRTKGVANPYIRKKPEIKNGLF
jgi:hypothetical protein